MERSGKTALITGASSGIGYELAKVFARNGHDLVLVARSETELRRIAQELEAACGIAVTVIAKDLFEPQAAHEVYQQTRRQGIVVNYLVNDAGQGVYGKFSETDLEQELKIIQLNINSLVVLTKLFLQDMLARNEGRILQLGSMVSKNPAPWSAIYGGTKAFVYNFNQALIQELEGTDVTVTVLRPGATDTDFFHKADAEEMEVVQKGQLGPADEVARDGYEAMMEGRNAIVSGLKNNLMDKAAQLMPDEFAAKQMKKMHQPASQNQKH